MGKGLWIKELHCSEFPGFSFCLLYPGLEAEEILTGTEIKAFTSQMAMKEVA